ncbi:MAG TPA: cysteine desulfurase-like protein [Thermoanaerobaculia bacterium]|nr:cysteine desulfurase-like protein [Thermoanaerobaculia bacterium]
MTFTETECRRARRDFPALERTLNGRPLAFLDGPAGSQVPQAVIDAISGYYRTCNANTHGEFPTSRESDRLMLETREAAAAFLGAPSWREISFGQNMTTLNFSLSHALAREMKPGDEIVITELDHESNRGPWFSLRERGLVVHEVALRHDGTLDQEDFARKISERTRLVALGLASNALGTVNDIPLARRLSREVGAWLLLDAVHHAAHFPIDVQALDTDFLLCSAYKFYGPHVGILYTRPGLLNRLRTDKLRVQDDEAPYRIETGTLNHAALAGVKAAIEYIASWGRGETLRDRVATAMTDIAAYEHGIASHYYGSLRQIPGITVWGPDFTSPHRAPTVSITLDGIRPLEIARRLGDQGLQVWEGHFYALRAMEVLGLAERGGVVRTGICMYNLREEIDRLLEALHGIAVR